MDKMEVEVKAGKQPNLERDIGKRYTNEKNNSQFRKICGRNIVSVSLFHEEIVLNKVLKFEVYIEVVN